MRNQEQAPSHHLLRRLCHYTAVAAAATAANAVAVAFDAATAVACSWLTLHVSDLQKHNGCTFICGRKRTLRMVMLLTVANPGGPHFVNLTLCDSPSNNHMLLTWLGVLKTIGGPYIVAYLGAQQ